MASIDSYFRSRDDGAGIWIGYGTENRSLPVRRINDKHFEFRCADITANMYLFTAVLLVNGLENRIKEDFETWKDCSIPVDFGSKGLGKYGIVSRMPVSLEEALKAMKSDESIGKWIGEDMRHQYLDLKEHEI